MRLRRPRSCRRRVSREDGVAHDLHLPDGNLQVPDGSGACTASKAIEGNMSEKVYLGATWGRFEMTVA